MVNWSRSQNIRNSAGSICSGCPGFQKRETGVEQASAYRYLAVGCNRVNQLRQMLGDLRQQLLDREAGLGRDLLDDVAAEDAVQCIRRHRLIRAGADPGRDHVVQARSLEFLDQAAKTAFVAA